MFIKQKKKLIQIWLKHNYIQSKPMKNLLDSNCVNYFDQTLPTLILMWIITFTKKDNFIINNENSCK